MSKRDLLAEIREARSTLLAAMDGLSGEDMLRPGAEGIWSVKDIMTHLVTWEAELVTALSRRLGRLYKDAPDIVLIEDIDEWNMEQYAQNAGRTLAAAQADFHGVHRHLLLAVEKLDEAMLSDPLRYEWMEGEPLEYLIRETAVWHEQEHAESIRAWREQSHI